MHALNGNMMECKNIIFDKVDLSKHQFQCIKTDFILPASFTLLPISGDKLQCGANVVRYFFPNFDKGYLPEMEPDELIALLYISGSMSNIIVIVNDEKVIHDIYCSFKYFAKDTIYVSLCAAHFDILIPDGSLVLLNDCQNIIYVSPVSKLSLQVKLNLSLTVHVCLENNLDIQAIINILQAIKDTEEDFPQVSVFIDQIAQDCLKNYRNTKKIIGDKEVVFIKVTSFDEFTSYQPDDESEIDFDDEDEDEASEADDEEKEEKEEKDKEEDKAGEKKSLSSSEEVVNQKETSDEKAEVKITDAEDHDTKKVEEKPPAISVKTETFGDVGIPLNDKEDNEEEETFDWFDDDILIGEPFTCDCYEHPDDVDLYNSEDNHEELFQLVNAMLTVKPMECLLNNCKLALKIMCAIKHKDLSGLHADKINFFISKILKFRHDYAFYKIFNKESTDMKFSDYLPILSDRTPDLIELNDNYVDIYELTVVSDIQKGHFQKGTLNESGKYKYEVEELESKGYFVNYKTIVISAFGENKDEIIKEYKVGQEMFHSITTLSTVLTRFFSDNMAASFLNNELMEKFTKYSPDRLRRLVLDIYDNSNLRYSFGTAKIKYAIRLKRALPRMITLLANKPDCKYLLIVYKNRKSFNFQPDEAYGIEKQKMLNAFKRSYIPLEYLKIQDTTGVVSDMADHNYFLPKKVTKENLNTVSITSANNLLTVNLMLDFDYNNHDPRLKDKLGFDAVPKNSLTIPKWFQNPLNVEGYEEKYLAYLSDRVKIIQDLPEIKLESKPGKWLNTDYLLIDKPMNVYETQKSIKLFKEKVLALNTLGEDGRIFKPKCATLYPMVKVLTVISTEQQLAKNLSTMDIGSFTSLILNQISKLDKVKTQVEHDEQYSIKYRKLMNAQTKITEFVLDSLDNLDKIVENEQYQQMLSERKKMQKDLESHIRSTGISRAGGVKYVTLGCGKNNPNYTMWQSEMPHIKAKGSSAYKTGMFMQTPKQDLISGYDKCINYLYSSEKFMSFDVLDEHLSPESDVLYKLKQKYMEEINKVYSYIKTLNVYNMSCFLSRLFRSVHYFSVCSLGRDHFMFDSFAPGCLLIVKGGNKLFKNNRSRWLRIFFPVSNQYADFIYPEGGSYKRFSMNGELYVATPWINFHETIILEGMFCAHKIANFYINSALSSTEDYPQTIHKLHFHTMMMFHQKRKTEKTLHDMRYILMNCFSIYSDYENLVQSMAIECKDNLQALIMNNLADNLSDFYTQCDKLSELSSRKIGHIFSQDKFSVNHPITRSNISAIADLSFAIYLTTLMSKAPVDNLSEQILDLKAVMESQDKFNNEVGSNDIGHFLASTAIDLSDENYEQKIFEKDFAFDPKLCWLIGRFCGDYIKDRVNTSTLENYLENIMNEPFQRIANTSGLRGRHFDNDFFGKKGYYIVYKDSCDLDLKALSDILESDKLMFQKRKMILDMNITLIEKYIEFFDDDMMIQMVHKIQKGGPREIYVMTYPTKVKQQILEKFFAKLCTYLPNEMISIASNKRMVWVHQRVHEHESDVTQDLTKIFNTYDCKRWAPHCNTLKYFYFISGMSHILPAKFSHIFIHFWDNYLNKKFVIRGKLYDSVVNNLAFKNFLERFTVVKSKRFNMKTKENVDYVFLAFMTYVFSFAMGIFNYLSSMMHAANQLYLRYLIQRIPKAIGKTPFRGDMILIAHSDDSGGKTYCNNHNSLASMLYMHEFVMKGCNHMLSKKKSNISKVYFEITSILYFAGVFIPILSKFSSLMSIAPTDGGYADDVLTSISKSIEMLTNGASFCQAYASQKICVNMVRRFYNLPTTQADYDMPYNCLGAPDSHPLMYLLAGSEYEDLKFIYIKPEIYNLTQRFLYALNGNLFSEKLTPNYTNFNKYYKTFSSIIEKTNCMAKNEQEAIALKFIDNSTTLGNLVMFSRLIQQNKFVWSLDYQNRSRRVVRALWVSVSNCIPTFYGLTNYKKIRNLCHQLILNVVHKEEVIEETLIKYLPKKFSDPKIIAQIAEFSEFNKKVYTATDDVGVLIKMLDHLRLRIDNAVPSNGNIRPVSLNIDIGVSPIGNDFNIDKILIEMYAPKFLPLMKDCYKGRGEVDILREYMPDVILKDITLLQKVLKSFQQRTNRRFIMYSQMPRGKNMVKDYKGVMQLLSYNSFPNKQIKGLNLPLGNRLILTGEYYLWGKEMELDNIIYDSYMMLSTFFNEENKRSGVYDRIMSMNVKLRDEVLPLNIMLKKLQMYEERMSVLAKTLLRMIRCTVERLYTQGISMEISDLNGCCYFIFTKEQMRTRSGWFGAGEVIMYWQHVRLKLIISDERVTHLLIQDPPKDFHDIITYIDLFLAENNYTRLTKCFERKSTNERGLVYRIREKTYEIDFGTNTNLFFPMEVVENVQDIGHFVQFNDMRMKTLKRIDIITEQTANKIYFVPSKFISALGLTHDFYMDDDHNKRIMMSLGYKGISIFDFITHRSYGTDFTIRTADLISDCESTEIYKIIYASGNYPSEMRPKAPGQQSGFMNSLISYKENNPNYEFNPDYTYMLPMISLGQVYTGSVLSQMYVDGKKMWETLTHDSKQALHDDTRDIIIKYRLTKNFDKADVRNILSLWGPRLVEYSLAMYDANNKERVLDSLMHSLKYMPLNFIEDIFIDIHSSVFGTLLSHNFKKKYMTSIDDNKFIIQTIVRYLITNSEFMTTSNDSYKIFSNLALKSIFKSKAALAIFNKSMSKAIYPALAIEYKMSDYKTIFAIMQSCAEIVCINIKDVKMLDRSLSFRRYGTVIGDNIRKNFNKTFQYMFTEIKKDFRLKNTTLIVRDGYMLPIDLNITESISGFKPLFRDDDEDFYEEVEDFMYEVSLGNTSGEYISEKSDLIDRLKIEVSPNTKNIYSCYEPNSSGYALASAVSSKTIIILEGRVENVNKNFRNGNIRLGYISPMTAKLNDLPASYWLVAYSVENGSNYVKSLNIIDIEKLKLKVPTVEKLEWAIMGKGHHDAHNKMIMEIIGGGGVKKVAEKIDEYELKKRKILERVKNLGYDEERYKIIEQKVNDTPLNEMINLVLGDIDKMFVDVEFSKVAEEVIKSETNRQALEKMTVMPINLGNTVGTLPPLERQLISNLRLRAEMNALCPDLADKLPSGQFFLTPDVKRLIENSCYLVCQNENNKNYERLLVISEILLSISNEALECENSSSSDNDSFIKIINDVMEIAMSGTPQRSFSKRVVPKDPKAIGGDY
jgi:hypothetical protein